MLVQIGQLMCKNNQSVTKCLFHPGVTRFSRARCSLPSQDLHPGTQADESVFIWDMSAVDLMGKKMHQTNKPQAAFYTFCWAELASVHILLAQLNHATISGLCRAVLCTHPTARPHREGNEVVLEQILIFHSGTVLFLTTVTYFAAANLLVFFRGAKA